MTNTKKFPEEFQLLPEQSEPEYILASRRSDKKSFKMLISRLAQVIGIESVGAKPVAFQGLQLPNVNNQNQPLSNGEWVILSGGNTYTNIGGGSNLVVPQNSMGVSFFRGSSWLQPQIITFPDILSPLYIRILTALNSSVVPLPNIAGFSGIVPPTPALVFQNLPVAKIELL